MSSKIYDKLKSCKEKKVRKRKTYVSDTKFIKLLIFCSLSSEKSFVRLENPCHVTTRRRRIFRDTGNGRCVKGKTGEEKGNCRDSASLRRAGKKLAGINIGGIPSGSRICLKHRSADESKR